ncbi:unnamed protein product, partial [marine sediment metagenome]
MIFDEIITKYTVVIIDGVHDSISVINYSVPRNNVMRSI